MTKKYHLTMQEIGDAIVTKIAHNEGHAFFPAYIKEWWVNDDGVDFELALAPKGSLINDYPHLPLIIKDKK